MRQQDCYCAVHRGATREQRTSGTMVAKRLSAPISQALTTIHEQTKSLGKDKKLTSGFPTMTLLLFCSPSQGKPLFSLFSHISIAPSRSL